VFGGNERKRWAWVLFNSDVVFKFKFDVSHDVREAMFKGGKRLF